MNRIALVLALAAGLGGFALLDLHKSRFEARASGGPPVMVVTARADLALGEPLTEDQLALRPLPSSYLEPRHIRADEVDKVIGVRVSTGVHAGESVLWTDLATATAERRDLSGLVQDGMRAITVRASATTTFGGLLRPGDRVDVLMTSVEGGSPETRPLLQNVLVLAIGTDTGADRRADAVLKAKMGQEITLSVTLAQAQILVHAGQRSELSVALRNPDDIAVHRELPPTHDDDLRSADSLERVLRTVRPAPTASKEIEHVR